jgi:hypothetical protein
MCETSTFGCCCELLPLSKYVGRSGIGNGRRAQFSGDNENMIEGVCVTVIPMNFAVHSAMNSYWFLL